MILAIGCGRSGYEFFPQPGDDAGVQDNVDADHVLDHDSNVDSEQEYDAGTDDELETDLVDDEPSPPEAPIGIELINPASSPAFNPSPTVQVNGVLVDASVTVFSDASCSQQVGNAIASGTSVQMICNLPGPGSYLLYAAQTDSNGIDSPCSTAYLDYVVSGDPEDSLPGALAQSIGVQSAPLLSDTTLSITGFIATFDNYTRDNFPLNIGVGDIIAFSGGSQYAIIKGVKILSDGVRAFVTTKDGASLPTATGQADFDIYRAFINFSNWRNQIKNPVAAAPDFTLSDRDLTDSDDESGPLYVACYADGEDTTGFSISSEWIRDPSAAITVFTPVSSNMVGISQRHNGRYGERGYLITSTSNIVARVGGPDIHIDGLQFSHTELTSDSTVVSFGSIAIPGQASLTNSVINCITIESQSAEGICTGGANDLDILIANNFVIGCMHQQGIHISEVNTAKVINNTIVNGYTGIYAQPPDATIAINNLLSGNNGDYSGTFALGSDYNASSDTGTTGGANDRTSQTFSFVAADDFHLAPDDSSARDHGVGPDLESNVPTSDIDGDPRSGPSCNIGADE
jgi:hypothetical protein